MTRFILQRLALSVLVLAGVLTVTFFLSRVLPSSPVELMLGTRPTTEQVERLTHELGLDRPIYVQYGRYLMDAARGEFGTSFRTGRPVLDEVRERAGASFELVSLSLLLAVLIGVPVGVLIAVRRGTGIEYGVRALAVTGGVIPSFFLGLALQLLFCGALRWLPLNGRIGPEVLIDHPFRNVTGSYLIDTALTGDGIAFGSALSHLILPLATLALSTLAVMARATGNLMIEALETDYIRTAHAAGLSRRRIYFQLALRPTLTSLLTVLGLTFGFLLGSSAFVEYVFDWPGLGSYVLNAVTESDFPAAMCVTLVLSTAYLAINLLIDVINCYVDPRLRPT